MKISPSEAVDALMAGREVLCVTDIDTRLIYKLDGNGVLWRKFHESGSENNPWKGSFLLLEAMISCDWYSLEED